MQTQIQTDRCASGQVDPKYANPDNQQRNTIPFIINGCAVSITSSAKNTDEPLIAVKEILLSAYRSRIASS